MKATIVMAVLIVFGFSSCKKCITCTDQLGNKIAEKCSYTKHTAEGICAE